MRHHDVVLFSRGGLVVNWTQAVTVNMTIIQHPELLSQLTGKNDAEVIAQYCSLMKGVVVDLAVLALLFLLLEQVLKRYLHHEGFVRWVSIVSFSLHAGLLLFIITIAAYQVI
jgi:threonine/homoserine/homoserine lactone efflux protein